MQKIIKKLRRITMKNRDSKSLIREIQFGIQMGEYTFEQILEKIEDKKMKEIVKKAQSEHKILENEASGLIKSYDTYKNSPDIMVKAMLWLNSNIKMMSDDADKKAAELITNGCNTGVKNLNKYINMYPDADPAILDTASKLISIEENLEKEMRPFL